MNIVEEIEREEAARVLEGKTIPTFDPGDTLKVHVRIKEGERERIQVFEGVCLAKNGGGINESFTVRKISYGEGVERVFPIYSPVIDSIVRTGTPPSVRTSAVPPEAMTSPFQRTTSFARETIPDLV